jgi:hypothetical protein
MIEARKLRASIPLCGRGSPNFPLSGPRCDRKRRWCTVLGRVRMVDAASGVCRLPVSGQPARLDLIQEAGPRESRERDRRIEWRLGVPGEDGAAASRDLYACAAAAAGAPPPPSHRGVLCHHNSTFLQACNSTRKTAAAGWLRRSSTAVVAKFLQVPLDQLNRCGLVVDRNPESLEDLPVPADLMGVFDDLILDVPLPIEDRVLGALFV